MVNKTGSLVTLQEWTSPVEEQLDLGSCTAQAVVGAYELLLNKYYPDKFTELSRLFLYYNARKIENEVDQDVGAYIVSAIKALRDYGICTEELWPYNTAKFKVMPTTACYLDARKRTIAMAYEVPTPDSIIRMLNEGKPVVIGTDVYNSLYDITNSDFILKMPMADEIPTGSHAMCVIGYDAVTKLFQVRNSFGDDWGDKGQCMIPYKYAEQNFSDMWAFDIQVK
jgi:C1A family cysteine protease